jgi:ribosomal protein S18 acetylase RimI-like enzyme
MAVQPPWRRMQVGTQMMDHLKGTMVGHNRYRATIEVPDNNLGSHLFLQKQLFKGVRVLRNFYEVTENDAYVMEYVDPLYHEKFEQSELNPKNRL